MLLTFSGLMAYTQVFIQSFASQIWGGSGTLLPTIFFTLAVVPLSCLNLEEQVRGQVVMSVLRFVSLSTLFFGLLVAIYMPSSAKQHEDPAFPESGQDVPLVHPAGFGLMFSTGVFSQLFQHSVPGLIRPLSAENKARVPAIFAGALASTCVCYIATGATACYHLGTEIQQSVNLNFVVRAYMRCVLVCMAHSSALPHSQAPERPPHGHCCCSVLAPASQVGRALLKANYQSSPPPHLHTPTHSRERSQPHPRAGVRMGACARVSLPRGGQERVHAGGTSYVPLYCSTSPAACCVPQVRINRSSLPQVLFPALDTISIFPLIANTLGSNLHTSFPALLTGPAQFLIRRFSRFTPTGADLQGQGQGQPPSKAALASAEVRAAEVLWRVLASVPPVVASIFITDLSLTLQLAGICGVVVALVIPALLQIAVTRRVADTPLVLPIHPYQFCGSGEVGPKAVIMFSVLAITVCVWQLLPMLATAKQTY